MDISRRIRRGIGRQRGRTALALAVAATLAAASAASLGADVGSASSHREAPLTAADPQIDNTDVYAFVSPDKPNTVTFVANWIPFEEPNGGPNFFPWSTDAHYDINIDSHGTGVPDITYRWSFSNQDNRGTGTFLYNDGPVNSLSDPHLLFKQTYTLTEIKNGTTTTLVSNGVSAPSDVGLASMPNYAALRDEAISTFEGGAGKSLAGQAADPFFLDLRVFDLLYGANLKEAGHNTLAGFNVNTIVLQVPISDVALNGDVSRNPVIGVWSTTERQTLQLGAGTATPTGPYVQVSRLGNPLVNEVVVPAGLKDAFNALTPDKDHTIPQVVAKVTDPEVPHLIQSIYGIPAPATPRNDLVEIFLTGICKSCGPIAADLNSQQLNKDVSPSTFVPSEELRLNMAVPPTAQPNRLGVLAGDLQGFPNGRRLTDDVVDIAVQAMEGAAQTGKLVPALAAGDGVDVPANPIGTAFPYLALPNTAAVNQAGGSAPAATSGSRAGTGSSAAASATPAKLPTAGVATGAGGTAVRRSGSAAGWSVSLALMAAVIGGAAVILRRRRTQA